MPALAISEADVRRLVAIIAASIAEATTGRLHIAAPSDTVTPPQRAVAA